MGVYIYIYTHTSREREREREHDAAFDAQCKCYNKCLLCVTYRYMICVHPHMRRIQDVTLWGTRGNVANDVLFVQSFQELIGPFSCRRSVCSWKPQVNQYALGL